MPRNILLCAVLILVSLSAPVVAQSLSPEDKTTFILEVSGFGDQLKVGSETLSTAVIEAIRQNNNRPYKITPGAAARFAKIAKEEFSGSVPEFKAVAANHLLQQLTPSELDALHQFYSTPLGLSASTKVHWVSQHMWPSIMPQVMQVLWPKLRERLAKDPELRKTLQQ